MRKLSLHYLVTMPLLGLIGCATVPPMAEIAATTSQFSYSGGRGSQSFPAPLSVVQAALGEAMTDLDFHSVQGTREGAVSRVEASSSTGQHVATTLRSHQGQTVVAVRVGWFGDEPLSRSLLDRIGIRLGSRPPEAIPASAPSQPSRNPYFARDAIPDSVMLRDFAEAPFRDRVVP